MELLVLQQPMAKDLRLIIAILKIGIDLERVGDMAVDIARIPAQSKNRIGLENVENIYLMGDISRRMLRESIKSLEERDSNLAREITARDYEIDALYVKVRDSLLRFIVRNPDLVGEATNLLMVNRHLERIGDHICNIDESIIYMVEGVREHLN
jgi:phosphate transport system protein